MVLKYVLDTPIGPVRFSHDQQSVARVELHGEWLAAAPSNGFEERIATEVEQYFNGQRSGFDLPYRQMGSPFRERVWQALSSIPYGSRLTYGELAKQLNSSARAVGGACRHNTHPLLVPCHRVVAATHIGGFSGSTQGLNIDVKRYLLTLESASDDHG